MTIRHIEEGHEQIFTAVTVSFDSGDTQTTANPGVRSVSSFVRRDDRRDEIREHYFQTGDVYVMNDAGATVASYRRLGPIPNFDLGRFKREHPGLPVLD